MTDGKIPPSITKIMEETKADFDQISTMPRFGFFSIPPNQIIGDRYYSTYKHFNHRVENRNVISEKRGIFTTPGKSGKGHDAYFQSMDTTDDKVQERLKQGWKIDYQKHMDKVQEQKKRIITPQFKYPGVQHYKEYFSQNPIERDYPLFKDKPKIAKKKDGKVITEKRGIFTQPMKKGFNNTPGIYFSYSPLHENDHQKIEKNKLKEKKRPKSSILRKNHFNTPFKPAALKKNECFSNIKDTYGYEDKYFDNLKKKADFDKKNKKKYINTTPNWAIKHMRPFTPNHMGKSGRDGLFDQKIWDCPQIPEKRIFGKKSAKKIEKPYKYNIMQEQTRFSPPIMTNLFNMRQSFPTHF